MPARRYALATAVTVALILYGGLFPFRGWSHADPLVLLQGLLHQRPRLFHDDILVNIVVFLPLGFFALRAARLRRGPLAGLALAMGLGFSLSLAVELFQAFLPVRKSSLVDVLSNVLGTVLGALVAVGTARDSDDAGSGQAFFHRYFTDSAGTPLLLLAIILWTLTYITPLSVSRWLEFHGSWRAYHLPSPLRMADLLVSTLYTLGLLTVTMAFARHPTRALPAALVYVIAVGFISLQTGSRSLTSTSILGAVFAFALACFLWRNTPQRNAMIAFWALALALILSESLPGERSIYRAFNWIPFRGHLARPLIGIESLVQMAWPVIAAACALRLALPAMGSGAGILSGSIFLLAAGFALEYTQTQIPDRFGDITVPFLMAGVWIACWSIHSQRQQREPPRA